MFFSGLKYAFIFYLCCKDNDNLISRETDCLNNKILLGLACCPISPFLLHEYSLCCYRDTISLHELMDCFQGMELVHHLPRTPGEIPFSSLFPIIISLR